MSVHAYKAQECFDDAKQYVNPQQDPVQWDMVNGLSALAQAVRALHADVLQLQNDVKQAQAEVKRLRR